MAELVRITSPRSIGDRAEGGQDCHDAMERAIQSVVTQAASSGWNEDEVAFALLHNAGLRIMKLMADRQVRDHPRRAECPHNEAS